METGDLLLFSDKTSFWSQCIKWLTQSQYSHVGMVIKSPTWISPELTGLYLFESTLSNANSININVRNARNVRNVVMRDLNKIIEQYPGNVFLRKLNTNRDELFHSKFKQAFLDAHDKPYNMNPIDWIGTFFEIHTTQEKEQENKFFCSALVAWIYIQLGCLSRSTEWTLIRPCDFADYDSLPWINCTLNNTLVLKEYTQDNIEYINKNSIVTKLVRFIGLIMTWLVPIIKIIFKIIFKIVVNLLSILWILCTKIYTQLYTLIHNYIKNKFNQANLIKQT